MEIQSITPTVEEKGMRIDKLLQKHFIDESRTTLQNWIKEGCVCIDDKPVKASRKVEPNEVINVTIPEPVDTTIAPENIPLDIVYEDHDVIVVNKPSGMIVHPSAGIYSGTLVNALLYHCDDLSSINGVNRPGIVHRIDKETSGLLMVAKNDKAHRSLSAQLEEHSVIRRYVALVHGVIPHNKGRIVAPIGRDPDDRQKMAVTDKNAKEAITNFTVLERFDDMTLIECRLETGRTHQIRVHMQYIGYPVYGDPKYGRRSDDTSHGQYLHAKILGFKHPITGEQMLFEAKLPDYFEEKIEELRQVKNNG
ncbi:23S rRNA pseudouridine1911/1915/1917 synthase [Sharpea azabuensis]|uniref:RluA family pseudouridine synthase n=1 Tax=Sharpea azabuensis TaxID=322505 RepID=UPI0008F0D309|nr:RluA family pseudouridine synthase [Sharpea azabuensis]SFD78939.1 23S rRNA pseudouridine1911/1915/1917 synthase [Sharpea azabuensis]SFK70471.1 23S rRNA pseudouridine1911/1915/1917 synthase [Sharpea azabuensis]